MRIACCACRCGADYVQKEQAAPEGLGALPDGARCCSLDGDADRLVYFTQAGGRFTLFDGDKIAILAAIYVRQQLDGLQSEVAAATRVGIVQTAYANGASTAYIKDVLRLDVVCTSTGACGCG